MGFDEPGLDQLEANWLRALEHVPGSLHSRVATPLHLCHLTRLNVDLKRAAWSCKAVFRERHNIVPWAERESEATLSIGCERCDRAFLVGNRKSRIGDWCHVGSLRSFLNRSGPDRTHHDNSLNSATSSRIGFRRSKASIHKEEREKQCEAST